MSFFSFLYNLILGPLVMLFDVVYALMYRMTNNEGLAIIAFSIAINLLILPLYRRADTMQEEERVRTQRLKRGVDHIKKVFKGDERFMMMQTYYRQNDYKPYYALSGSLSLLLEIPFFIAAYRFLSELDILVGSSFGPIADLSMPDGLIHAAGFQLNLLPVLMTAINIVSGIIYSKGMPLKSKLQLYGMAMIFLVFLYSSPSGLVFYWTLNNLFSLIKNVFYKIKNPVLVLCVISAAFAGVCLPWVMFWISLPSPRIQSFVTAGLVAMLIPLPVYILIRKFNYRFHFEKSDKADSALFFTCCLLMTLLTGAMIPSAVIAASPEEFMEMSAPHSPVVYIFRASVTASGTFLCWMSIFYRLFSSSVKRIAGIVSAIVSGMAVVNYMFFGKGYGNMSAILQYDTLFSNTSTEIVNNAVVLLVISAVLIIVWKKRKAIINSVCIAVCAALLIMSCKNTISIRSTINSVGDSSDNAFAGYSSNSGIDFPLDKKGKNVVVIMLDRAICDFFPFILNEKPELQEQFAGFTYYPNTISYGDYTIVGFPGLYGGYEYIPEEMNRRKELSIRKKQDEALKVMPLLFSQNGFETTVCDPPYAGMRWNPDLSIYDQYPEIIKYNTKGRFTIGSDNGTSDDLLNRNMFAYGLFRTSPVLVHESLYNRGLYNHSSRSYAVQVIKDMYTASGGSDKKNTQFAKSYGVLENLSAISRITDDGSNTFLILDNDTTHDVMMLQEPAYEPSDFVDNRAYEAEHRIRTTADGNQLTFSNPNQIMHYQCNMAAMIKIGKWLDYLRQNGVYDNTRIIIVSDHGRGLGFTQSDVFKGDTTEASNSIETVYKYKALLLVKDFDSSEITTDTTFMTNADTPSIALDGLIQDPVNPFTGNAINSDGKNVPVHRLAVSASSSHEEYYGDVREYKDLKWVELTGDDTGNLSAWHTTDH